MDMTTGRLQPGSCDQPCRAADGIQAAFQVAEFQELGAYLESLGFLSIDDPRTLLLRDAQGTILREVTTGFYRHENGDQAWLSFTTDFAEDTNSYAAAQIRPATVDSVLALSIAGEIVTFEASEIFEAAAASSTPVRSMMGATESSGLEEVATSSSVRQAVVVEPVAISDCAGHYHGLCSGTFYVSCDWLLGKAVGKLLESAEYAAASTLLPSDWSVPYVADRSVLIPRRIGQLPGFRSIPLERRGKALENAASAVGELIANTIHEFMNTPSLCDLIYDETFSAGCGSIDEDQLFLLCCVFSGGHSCGSVCCPEDVPCGPGGTMTCGCPGERICANGICCPEGHQCAGDHCEPVLPPDNSGACSFDYPDWFLDQVSRLEGSVVGEICAPGGAVRMGVDLPGEAGSPDCYYLGAIFFQDGTSADLNDADGVFQLSHRYAETADIMPTYRWISITYSIHASTSPTPADCSPANGMAYYLVEIPYW